MNTVLEVTILFFKINRVHELQPSTFSWYKNQLKNITKSSDEIFLRKIFNNLIKLNVIKKIKINKSIFYTFDPYFKKKNCNNVIIKKIKKKSYIEIDFN